MSSKASTKKTTQKSTKKTTKEVNPAQLNKDTQLIPIEDFDFSRIVYSDPKLQDIPDGSGKYRRVHLSYMYDDKTIGPILISLGKKYCFGVQPDNIDKDGKIMKDDNGKDKPLKGYRAPLVMTSQGKNDQQATPEELREVDFFDDLRAEVIRYTIENKKLIGKGAKADSFFQDVVSEPLYRKRDEEGNIIDEYAPKLYTSLIYYSNRKEFGTDFYGPSDKKLDPLQLTNSCYMYPTIRIDSLFVGAKAISIQHRLYDATVEPISRATKKRLAPKSTVTQADVEESDEPSSGGNPNTMMDSDEEGEVAYDSE